MTESVSSVTFNKDNKNQETCWWKQDDQWGSFIRQLFLNNHKKNMLGHNRAPLLSISSKYKMTGQNDFNNSQSIQWLTRQWRSVMAPALLYIHRQSSSWELAGNICYQSQKMWGKVRGTGKNAPGDFLTSNIWRIRWRWWGLFFSFACRWIEALSPEGLKHKHLYTSIFNLLFMSEWVCSCCFALQSTTKGTQYSIYYYCSDVNFRGSQPTL